MKSATLTGVFLVAFSCVFATFAQGTFQNLDFELANPASINNPLFPDLVTPSSALSFWTVSFGSAQATYVTYNNYDLGTANASLFGPAWNSVNPGIIDGGYTVALQAGLGPNDDLVGASISQNGTIPLNAMSLLFKTVNFEGVTPISVSFAGDNLTLFPVSSGVSISGQPYNLYAANIASFEGQSGQLEFTAPFYNWIELDDISFSTTTVTPEPSPFILMGIGGSLFAIYRRFAHKRE